MQYQKFDWPSFLNARLEEKGVRQVDLAKRWGMKPQSIHGLLNRTDHKWESLQKLSRVLGEDLVVYCLCLESQEILRKAWEVGIRPGEGNPLLGWQDEKVRLEKELEEKTGRVDQLATDQELWESEKDFLANDNDRLRKEVDSLREGIDLKTSSVEREQANGEKLQSELKELQKRYDALEKKASTDEKANEKELDKLKEEKRESEYESRLKISVLEAKLEVLQSK